MHSQTAQNSKIDVQYTVDIESQCNSAASTKSDHMEFKLCPPYSAQRKSGRPQEEKQIKGAIEIAIDKMEKKKKMVETRKKQKPIEPDDLVEYKNINKKHKKDDKSLGEAMGKTVAKADLREKGRWLRGKGESRRVAIRRG